MITNKTVSNTGQRHRKTEGPTAKAHNLEIEAHGKMFQESNIGSCRPTDDMEQHGADGIGGCVLRTESRKSTGQSENFTLSKTELSGLERH